MTSARTPGHARRATLAAAALCAATLLPLFGLEVPFLAGRVNDLADMLPAGGESTIEARLERLESEHGAQVAVLTIATLDGEVLEDYSLRVVETWQLGRADVDDGVLLLIVRDDRKMRLEVGYGLEPTITDLASGRILDDVIRPRFQQGDFAGGIEQAIEVIASLIEGEDALPPPGTGSGSSGGAPASRWVGFLMTVGFFSLIAVSSRGCAGWGMFLVLTPLWFGVSMSILGRPWGLVPGVLWMFGFPLAWFLIGRRASARGGGSSARRRGGGWWSSGGGSGGFSGGGFSGGGGSFGGGGGSGSW